MRNVMIALMFVVIMSGWTQEAFVYRDRIVVEVPFQQAAQLMFPAEAIEVDVQPKVAIIQETLTNLYPNEVSSLVKEYTSLTNDVTQKRRRLQTLEKRLNQLNDRIKLYQDMLRGLAENQALKSGDLMEKYERQLTQTEETWHQSQNEINNLRQEITTLEGKTQEIHRFLMTKVMPMKVWRLEKPSHGLLRYHLKGGWKTLYTFSLEKETLRADVHLFSPHNFEQQVASLWIIGYPYVSQQMEERLPRWRLYLQQTYVSPAPRSKMAGMPAEAMAQRREDDAIISLATAPVESTEGEGTVWHITNRVLLSKTATISLWEPRKIGVKTSYFVLVPRSSWGWYAVSISNTLAYTLQPGEIVIESQGKTKTLPLLMPVVPHGTYAFPGIEVRDIEVRREKIRNYRDMPGLLRHTILHEQAWKTTIKNRLNKTISLVVWDRIPVPSEERIIVKNVFATDKSNADIQAAQNRDGILKWQISLRPGEEKVLSVGYTIEYPKNTEYYGQEEE